MEIKTFFIESFGCQMNTAEANSIASVLVSQGYKQVNSPEQADLAIINTCSVRQSAENRVRGHIGSYAPLKKAKKMKLVLTGCMADRLGQTIKKEAPYVDYVVCNNDKFRIGEIVSENKLNKSNSYVFSSIHYKEGEFSSYVPIMNGCNNFCSYCIVPYVRGREISRNPDEILREIDFLEEKHVREITLLGQNVNSYQFASGDRTIDFAGLLKMISKRCNSIKWVRFDSPHPKDFSDELIDVIAENDNIASHIHLPMQSGSDKILKLMNRKYSADQFANLIDRIRNKVRDVTFSSDIMVGFPGEDDKDFEKTLELVKYSSLIEAFMYFWNPIEGTVAFKMENQISEQEKKNRLAELIGFHHRNAEEIKLKRVGRVEDVLLISQSRDNKDEYLGRTEHNESIVFSSDRGKKYGDFVRVKSVSLNGNTYIGEMV